MIDYNITIKLNSKLTGNMAEVCDKIIYTIASETLRESESVIPYRTGKMHDSSINAGVKGSNMNYYIGSYTGYAWKVWNYPETTNWTTPGTNSRWYSRVWEEKGDLITRNAVGRNKL